MNPRAPFRVFFHRRERLIPTWQGLLLFILSGAVFMGAHARRSQLLFQKVSGEDSQVDIMVIENREHDPRRWWKSSIGVRTVMDEFIACIYALVVFPFEINAGTSISVNCLLRPNVEVQRQLQAARWNDG
jgi:hypothetical protein